MRGSAESLSRTPVSNATARGIRSKRKLEELYEGYDSELEKQIEDAMIELGRLRTLVDAKTVEINILITQRYTRLKVSTGFFLIYNM